MPFTSWGHVGAYFLGGSKAMTTFFSLAFLAASVSGKSIALFILISAGQACITIWGLNSMTDWRKAFQITWGTSGEPVGILWGTGGEPGTFCGEPGFWGSLGPWVFVHLGGQNSRPTVSIYKIRR